MPEIDNQNGGTWIRALTASELEPGDADRFEHNGLCVAVFNLDGEFFATSGICTHEHAFLSEGYVDGDTVECPLHQGIFNIRNGQPLAPPVTVGLKTYKTKVEAGDVYVLLEV